VEDMIKVFEIVPDWENKNLKCCKCGEAKNVRQKNVQETGDNVYYCDACVLKRLFPKLYK
jgi:predicted RNA-binding Zn-ribbon protein involved in translation (DUF1610 family)